ncbi:serine-rich adhesin for platelets-like [Oppia nitens]|uniref:serine-rich adhesin for platelets-like n=1 Tax=Oppia nitens TaxID=1686743 RepID=UPI0023D9F5E9|nr:serine-rich adhesin for platelets-like [Oppia nitens]
MNGHQLDSSESTVTADDDPNGGDDNNNNNMNSINNLWLFLLKNKSITTQTFGQLAAYGYDNNDTIISLDIVEDLPMLTNITIGQRSLLKRLINDYRRQSSTLSAVAAAGLSCPATAAATAVTDEHNLHIYTMIKDMHTMMKKIISDGVDNDGHNNRSAAAVDTTTTRSVTSVSSRRSSSASASKTTKTAAAVNNPVSVAIDCQLIDVRQQQQLLMKVQHELADVKRKYLIKTDTCEAMTVINKELEKLVVELKTENDAIVSAYNESSGHCFADISRLHKYLTNISMTIHRKTKDDDNNDDDKHDNNSNDDKGVVVGIADNQCVIADELTKQSLTTTTNSMDMDYESAAAPAVTADDCSPISRTTPTTPTDYSESPIIIGQQQQSDKLSVKTESSIKAMKKCAQFSCLVSLEELDPVLAAAGSQFIDVNPQPPIEIDYNKNNIITDYVGGNDDESTTNSQSSIIDTTNSKDMFETVVVERVDDDNDDDTDTTVNVEDTGDSMAQKSTTTTTTSPQKKQLKRPKRSSTRLSSKRQRLQTSSDSMETLSSSSSSTTTTRVVMVSVDNKTNYNLNNANTSSSSSSTAEHQSTTTTTTATNGVTLSTITGTKINIDISDESTNGSTTADDDTLAIGPLRQYVNNADNYSEISTSNGYYYLPTSASTTTAAAAAFSSINCTAIKTLPIVADNMSSSSTIPNTPVVTATDTTNDLVVRHLTPGTPDGRLGYRCGLPDCDFTTLYEMKFNDHLKRHVNYHMGQELPPHFYRMWKYLQAKRLSKDVEAINSSTGSSSKSTKA